MKKLFTENGKRIFIMILLVIVFYKAINNLEKIRNFTGFLWELFLPFTLGLIFALFLDKPVKKVKSLFEKLKIKHSLPFGIGTVYFIIICVIALIIKFIIPPFFKSVEDFFSHLPGYLDEVNNFLESSKYNEFFSLKNFINPKNLTKYIGFMGTIADFFLTFFISIVVSIYLLIEKEDIFKFLNLIKSRLFTNEKFDILFTYFKKSISLFYSYFTGLLTDSVIIGSISLIIFLILKIPYAFILGLIVIIGNLIPFFGPIIATAIITLISVIAASPATALWVLLIQIVLGQIDSNLIQPKILGKSTGISPLLVLLSVTVFGKIWGACGMIVGVPVCAIIKEVIIDYLNDKKINCQ